MNYHNIPLFPQRDSLTSMSYMLFKENNLVTYRGTTGAMITWGGFSSWRSKQPGQGMDLSVSPESVHMDVPPPPSPVKACVPILFDGILYCWPTLPTLSIHFSVSHGAFSTSVPMPPRTNPTYATPPTSSEESLE